MNDTIIILDMFMTKSIIFMCLLEKT